MVKDTDSQFGPTDHGTSTTLDFNKKSCNIFHITSMVHASFCFLFSDYSLHNRCKKMRTDTFFGMFIHSTSSNRIKGIFHGKKSLSANRVSKQISLKSLNDVLWNDVI